MRLQSLSEVEKSLRKQTYKDFEWVVISPFDLDFNPEGIKTKVLKDPPKKEGDYWSFNKAMNEAIRNCEGELIVSVQDYTGFIPEGLEKFMFFYENGYDKALISGVGDKFDDKGVKMWVDPRKTDKYGTFYECFLNDVEFNYCSIPKKAFYDCGGFDEWLDKYAGMDHISVQERLNELGYKFYLDQTNESKSRYHDRLPGWEENLALKGPYAERKQYLISTGEWPVLKYLVNQN